MIVQINEGNIRSFPYELLSDRHYTEERVVFGDLGKELAETSKYLADLTSIVLYKRHPSELVTMHRSDIKYVKDSLAFGDNLISILKCSGNITLNAEEDVERYRVFMSCCDEAKSDRYGVFKGRRF